MPTPIPANLKKSRQLMDAALHRDINPDMHVRHFCVYGRVASLYYAEGLCSVDFLQHYVLTPLIALRNASLAGDLAEELRAMASGPITVVGDGARLTVDALTSAGISCRIAPPGLVMQNAVSVALEAEQLAAEGKLVSAQELETFYLRPPQAERLRDRQG